MTGSFWQQDCHKRGTALTHAHSADCSREHDPRHGSDQCCHCGERASSWVPTEVLSPPVPIVRAVARDHAYQFTIGGRCGECQGLEDDHPLIGIPDPMTGCDVDHRSLRTALLIGDGGLEWASCPRCGAKVEPKMSTGFPDGKAEGRGRGYFTQRHRNELEKLVPAWLKGDR